MRYRLQLVPAQVVHDSGAQRVTQDVGERPEAIPVQAANHIIIIIIFISLSLYIYIYIYLYFIFHYLSIFIILYIFDSYLYDDDVWWVNVQEPIDSQNEGDVFSWQTQSIQNHDHGYNSGLRDSGSADTGRSGCDAVDKKRNKQTKTIPPLLWRPSPAFPAEPDGKGKEAESSLPDGHHFTERERDVSHLRDEEGGNSFIQSRAVHVDGGADGHDKSRHTRINAVLILQASQSHRKCCRAASKI